MSKFPKLIPAFTAHVVIDRAVPVGVVSKGNPLTVAPIIAGHGFLRSEPDYPVKVDAVFLHGADFIRQDPSGKHVRLDVNSIVKDKSGAVITFKYSGVVDVTGPAGKALSGSADAKTTEFGDSFTHVLFETGGEDLRILEQKVYVAAGRFIIEAGKPPIVEYLISEVAI